MIEYGLPTGAVSRNLPDTPFLAGPAIPRHPFRGYIAPMRRCSLSRLTGLCLAVLVSLSAPGVGLAHGYAHHEAKEHADHEREHHHGVWESERSASELLTAAVENAGGSGDHDHPELSQAMSGRADAALFVVAPRVELPAYVVVASHASLLLTAAPPRAGPPDAPPRQPRAPPLG